MVLESLCIRLEPLEEKNAEAVLNLELRNQKFFERFSIDQEEDFYTIEGQLRRMQNHQEEREDDKSYYFGIYLKDSEELIGTIGVFKIGRGPAQCGMVGYSLDKEQNGNGYMTEAVKLIIHYAFNSLKLHRIEAGVMPANFGSLKVLEKSGFHKEGIAKQNVKIRGKWEDHQMLAIINPNDYPKIDVEISEHKETYVRIEN